MTLIYNKIERTHLRSDELLSWLSKDFPNLSAMTLMTAEKMLKIQPIFVGAETYYPAEQAERIATLIRESDTEYKNGFLVFCGQWTREPLNPPNP